jgi:Carbohydrate esterase, sialic acid-specific acetylesterase/Concanavalin A-like lectin/glucanases superfamily
MRFPNFRFWSRVAGRTICISILGVVAALVLARTAAGQTEPVAPVSASALVALDADKLAEGTLAEWANGGSLGGSFTNDGTSPMVQVVAGVKAVSFSGRDRMLASFAAPESLTGAKPWTCVVRAFNPRIGGEETMVAWASRPNNSLQIEYGSARNFGAIGTYNDPNTLGWTNGAPAAGEWHTLAYVYTGGNDGKLRAYADGHLQSEKTASLNTKTGGLVMLGACLTANPENRQTQPFSGSLASVQIYDRVLTPKEIWGLAGQAAAFAIAPAPGEVLRTLDAKLEWQRGTEAAKSFDVYFGGSREEVAKAENTSGAGEAKIFKGNQTQTSYNVTGLEMGRTNFWRVDERDADGKVAWRGDVQEFATEDGRASAPTPVDAWPLPVGEKPVLTWKPGAYASSQILYYGDDAGGVWGRTTRNSGSRSGTMIVRLPASTASMAFPTDAPEAGKAFYWRVDEVNSNGLPVSRGEVWSFRAIKRKLKVYLLGGQSNMTGCTTVNGLPEYLRGYQRDVIIYATGGIKVGQYGWGYLKEGLGQDYNDNDGHGTFGPEVTFGHDMAAANPGEVIALIKCGWGGTDLGVQWRPPSAGGNVGPLYRNFVAAMHDGLNKLDPAFEPEICGMIWMQGEEDAQRSELHASYETNLTCFIHDIREEFKKPELPFAFGQISTTKTYDPPLFGADVRAAQLAVSQKVPHTAMFETGDYKLVDRWHYDPAGMISLGQRFAKAMQGLEKQEATAAK